MVIRTQPLTNDELFDAICKRLKTASDRRRTATWDLVDELLNAEDRLGERFSQAVEITKLSAGALANYLTTGRAWPASGRHLDMPFDYHSTLNSLAPEQRVAAMMMAKKSEWTRDDLRWRVAAWKGGDALAFDPRHKVGAPARKVRDIPENHAGVIDEDKPVFDSTAAGEGMKPEHERADFEVSDENQNLAKALRALEKIDIRILNPSGLSRDAIQAAIAKLHDIAVLKAKFDQRHIVNFQPAPKDDDDRSGAARAVPPASTEEPAQGDAEFRSPSAASPTISMPGTLTAAGQEGEGNGANTPPRIPSLSEGFDEIRDEVMDGGEAGDSRTRDHRAG